MQAVNYSAFRRNLKSYLRSTRDDAEEILVTNNDPSENVVVVNLRDWESIQETLRIYENEPLHEKLLRGKAEVLAGSTEGHPLVAVSEDDAELAHA